MNRRKEYHKAKKGESVKRRELSNVTEMQDKINYVIYPFDLTDRSC